MTHRTFACLRPTSSGDFAKVYTVGILEAVLNGGRRLHFQGFIAFAKVEGRLKQRQVSSRKTGADANVWLAVCLAPKAVSIY